VRKKEPLLIEQLPAILTAMPDDQPAIRDRALLLLGYAGAFRRSELVALDVERLRFSKAGCYVWIASAKNDPRKKGRELFVPRLPATSAKAELCAVAALERWLAIVGQAGAVFRTFDLRGELTITRLDSGDVARVLRRRTAMAGVVGDFAGHSLRRGFITNAAKKKVPIENIKRVTGQRSSGIVLDYVAAATLDDEPPALGDRRLPVKEPSPKNQRRSATAPEARPIAGGQHKRPLTSGRPRDNRSAIHRRSIALAARDIAARTAR